MSRLQPHRQPLKNARRGARRALVGRAGKWPARRLESLSRLGPSDDHIDLPTTAPGTDEPIAPIKNAGPGAELPGHLGRVRLDLMAARLAPHDQPHLGVRCVAERHWRTGW